MALRNIVEIGDPVLNKKCRKIVKKQEPSELQFKLLHIVSIIWKFKRKDTTASC